MRYNTMKTRLAVTSFIILFFANCSKKNSKEDGNCENIKNAKITSNSPVTIGQTIKFGTQEVGGFRIYEWTGPDNYRDQYPSDSLTDAQLKNEGWYHLHLYSLDGGCEKFDSVYIDVKLQQGSPSCTVTNNSTNYNNMGTETYTSVSKTIAGSASYKVLKGNGPSGSNITIYFHTRWRNTEPEDGIYKTINVPSFDPIDNNYNKVFVTTTKSSIYWASHEGQTVYVSHANGKLQVRFCSLAMGGNNGTSFTTLASGNIIEL
jgi:hypothetical protein